MSFTMKCPYCRQTVEAEDDWVGQQAQCPGCSRTITIAKGMPAHTPRPMAPSPMQGNPCGQPPRPMAPPPMQGNPCGQPPRPMAPPPMQGNPYSQPPRPMAPPPMQGNPYSQPPRPMAPPQSYAAGPFKSYMTEAVLSTIFCCLPLGVVAIVFASKANSLYRVGQWDEAYAAAHKAMIFSYAADICGLVIVLINVGLQLLALL